MAIVLRPQICDVISPYALYKYKYKLKLECGPMPKMMAAQKNMGGENSTIPFLVPRRTVWVTPAPGVPCNNAANIGER